MSDIIIKAENLGKKYIIGHQAQSDRYLALRDVVTQNVRGFFSKTRDLIQGKDIIQGDTQEEFWALRDVSFEIRRGDAVGIIGRNGAGKSTLLKVLSRITEPSAGRVTIRGRVASLLEVGTGFHPELTGRENIYLNGAILGMARSEIRYKFDEIVAFAEVEKFLDTPVKRYSSGMYVRLAFAVAAHLEPEILVVDEVLAVGDAEFQKKCLGKMGDVAHEGRTVLFVSHNMAAIKKLCTKGILLENGSIVNVGKADDIVELYSNTNVSMQDFIPISIDALGIVIQKISLNEDIQGSILPFKPLSINVYISSEKEVTGIGLQVMLTNNSVDGILFTSNTKQTKDMDILLSKGINIFTCLISSLNFCSGKYMLGLAIDQPNVCWHYFNYDVLAFEILETTNGLLPTAPNHSLFYLDHSWICHNKGCESYD